MPFIGILATVALRLAPYGGEALVAEFPAPTAYRAQDGRKWGSDWFIRFGPALARPRKICAFRLEGETLSEEAGRLLPLDSQNFSFSLIF